MPEIPYDESSYHTRREEAKERVKNDDEYREKIKNNLPWMYYGWEFTPDPPEEYSSE